MNIGRIIKEEVLINELLINNEYNSINSLESTMFIIFREHVYFFDYSDNDYISKVRKFGEMLYSLNVVNEFPNNSNIDSSERYLKFELGKLPSIIVGGFIVNGYNKSIPSKAIVAEIFNNPYYEIRVSDTLKKLMKLLPNIQYYYIDGKYYSKTEIIKNYNSNYNTDFKLPEDVYHGTSSEHIFNILKYGIRPTPENSAFSVKNEKYIFLTTSFNIADEYAKLNVGKNFKLRTYEVIIPIKSNRLDRDKIVYDFDFYNRNIGNGNKEYNKMSGSDDNFDLPFSSKSNKRVDGLYKKFGYNGIILPTKIDNVYVNTGYSYSSDYELFTIKEFIEYDKNKTNEHK